jgi:hypothetical protein
MQLLLKWLGASPQGQVSREWWYVCCCGVHSSRQFEMPAAAGAGYLAASFVRRQYRAVWFARPAVLSCFCWCEICLQLAVRCSPYVFRALMQGGCWAGVEEG